MISAATIDWQTANQGYLAAALNVVRATLERHAARVRGDSAADDAPTQAADGLAAVAAALPEAAALDTLCATFGLSAFERDILLLCAGIELDSRFAALCAVAHDHDQLNYPTFSLALAAFRDAHWSALTPDAPLRSWRLIEIEPGGSLTTSRLRIDERVLHYLVGVQQLDERLVGVIEPLEAIDGIVPSHAAIAERIVAAWRRARNDQAVPAIQLCGNDPASQRTIAAAVCAATGLDACLIRADTIPPAAGEHELVLRLCVREAALRTGALILDCSAAERGDDRHDRAIERFIERARCPLIVLSRPRRRSQNRAVLTFEIAKPETNEQRALWRQAVDQAASALNGMIDALVAQFSLGASEIRAAVLEARNAPDEFISALWAASRLQARPRLDELAERIEPVASWDDLVLPDAERAVLHEIAAHVRNRTTVYETWGFGAKSARGLGISALFAGDSGTGKTMAAEVLARDLRLDLYRIDLSGVVSKYIGETEKNLRRLFDAAEDSGVILFFDEADALFGKRSEVKDSHDRYANIEISYLLQRMESYRGLSILTTNLRSAVDQAFLRRIRFVVQFPFPNPAQRAEIWQRIFPDSTPTENLDVRKLARLNVAGGNIRNIALNAAFLAADANEPVRMAHLLRAARTEYSKLEKPLTEAEIGGWT